MPDEARKWLDEYDKWQKNETINSETMPVVYVKNFIAYPASQHLERLLAANETLKIMMKEQSQAADTYYAGMKQLEAANERLEADIGIVEQERKHSAETGNKILADRAALVAYVRAEKLRWDIYDGRHTSDRAYSFWLRRYKRSQEAWQALSDELREEIEND